MNRTIVWTIVLAVGILTMASVAASRPYAGGPRSVVFSSEPIPCHVYLKAKHGYGMGSNYVPDSFFQAQVQLIRVEPDVTTIHPEKAMLQAALDSSLAARKNPKYAKRVERDIKDLQTRLKDMEDHPKVFILRVVDRLEGSDPGDEIVMSVGIRDIRLYQALLADEAKRYVLGYQGHDQKVYAAGFWRTPQEVQEEETVMGTFKKWVRWFISECDNV